MHVVMCASGLWYVRMWFSVCAFGLGYVHMWVMCMHVG